MAVESGSRDKATSILGMEAAVRRVSVLLADDNPEILQQATHVLEAEFEVVGAVLDGESLLQAFERSRPDIVVLAISMGKLSGLDAAHRLLRMGHQARIVFLTVHEEAEFIRAAFVAGAAAYVMKSRLNSDLVGALHAALAGRIFISPSLQQA